MISHFKPAHRPKMADYPPSFWVPWERMGHSLGTYLNDQSNKNVPNDHSFKSVPNECHEKGAPSDYPGGAPLR